VGLSTCCWLAPEVEPEPAAKRLACAAYPSSVVGLTGRKEELLPSLSASSHSPSFVTIVATSCLKRKTGEPSSLPNETEGNL